MCDDDDEEEEEEEEEGKQDLKGRMVPISARLSCLRLLT